MMKLKRILGAREPAGPRPHSMERKRMLLGYKKRGRKFR